MCPYREPIQPRKGWPHDRGLCPLLFLNNGVGSSTSHKNTLVKVLWDETWGFSSISEKTGKSNHLQMSIQRQHFLFSYFKTPSVGLAGVWTHNLLLSKTGVLPTQLIMQRLKALASGQTFLTNLPALFYYRTRWQKLKMTRLYLHTCVVYYHSFKLDLWVQFGNLLTSFQKQTITLLPIERIENLQNEMVNSVHMLQIIFVSC